MKIPPDNPPTRIEILFTIAIFIFGAACAIYLVREEISPSPMKAMFVPVSLLSKQVADYYADPQAIQIPAARLDIIAALIRDQEPDADVAGRYAVVEANMLTPVTWLVTPTPSRTPTRPPTFTPTLGDPWVPIGQSTVSCRTEIILPTVKAQAWKFQMLSGGGEDKLISFYCCGSYGAEWRVNGVWQPVTNPSSILRIGESRESGDLGSAIADRLRFNIGCNDGEKIDVRVYYLPSATTSLTATTAITLTSISMPTATPTTTTMQTASAASSPTPSAMMLFTPSATLTRPISAISSPMVLTPTNMTTATPVPSTPTPLPTKTVAAPTQLLAPTGNIAFHRNVNGTDGIWLLNLSNYLTSALVDVGPVLDLTMNTNASIGAWSPDNSKFVYISTAKSGLPNVLKVLDLVTNTNKTLVSSDSGGGLSSPSWSPDGRQIAFVRVSGDLREWAVHTVNFDGSPCEGQSECEIRSNPLGEQYRSGLSWSSQGTYVFGMSTLGVNSLYTMLANGTGLTIIKNNPVNDSTPAWSPDGRMIAFTSTRDGYPQIYLMNRDGSGLRRVSQGNAADFSPTWSPDGNWLAFSSQRAGVTDIYMMDLNGGSVTRLTKTGGDRPSWSR